MYINKIIKEYTKNNPIRFHMPGHKGKLSSGRFSSFFAQGVDFSAYDITETDETLNIYDFTITNEKIFTETAKLFGANITLYSCSGATLAIQAALAATAAESTVLCIGDVHVSAENAFALCGITPIYCNSISENLFNQFNPSAVFMTSEDYYGKLFITEVTNAAKLCKRYSVPLICDNSHGSHLAFHEGGSLHPLSLGADIVIDSAHKTMPVLTGGAFLHLNGKISEKWHDVLKAMKIFASTSPSYLIAASLESGANFMNNNKHLLKRLLFDVNRTKQALKNLGCIFYEYLGYKCDPFRLTIIAKNAKEIDAKLKANNIYSEFSNDTHIVLIPSICNSSGDFDILIDVISKTNIIPVDKTKINFDFNSTGTIQLAVSPRTAYFGKHKTIPTKECVGQIAAYPVYHYPPAIPIVHAGERILKGHIPKLSEESDKVTIYAEDI